MDNLALIQKNVFIVLGMGRSGTSAITRSLLALGIDLGDRLLPGNQHNEKGFWEDADILYKINRGVHHALNDNWLTVGRLTDTEINQHPTLRHYQQDAIRLLQQRLAATQHWGFKDPHTVKILPFWQAVFKTLTVDEHYIITIRNPLAIAHSHQKFFDTELEIGMMSWLVCTYAAIEGTHGKKRVVVAYEQMLQDPVVELQRIHQSLGIAQPLNDTAINEYAKTFLDRSLNHHDYTDEAFKTHRLAAVVPLCVQLHALMMRLAKDEIDFNSIEFQSAWQEIKQAFTVIFPAYDYTYTLLRQNRNLKRTIRAIHRSIFYRITYPLRIIENMLRNYRRQRRIAKYRFIPDKFA
ncbi:MAG TPA: sulfotransferase [Gammaproteobacteria bacterium]|jgi:hypothetical protein|nr:sulfotransferase [Gammaproteobacteria bacterium]